MPDFTQIYNFTDAVLSASAVSLTAAGITSVPLQRGADNLTTPRVEVQVSIGSPAGPGAGHRFQSGSIDLFDAYNGTLNAMVVTEKINNPASHSLYTALAYAAIGDITQLNANMPYHKILQMTPNAVNVRVEPEVNADISVLSLAFIILIRREAWDGVTMVNGADILFQNIPVLQLDL